MSKNLIEVSEDPEISESQRLRLDAAIHALASDPEVIAEAIDAVDQLNTAKILKIEDCLAIADSLTVRSVSQIISGNEEYFQERRSQHTLRSESLLVSEFDSDTHVFTCAVGKSTNHTWSGFGCTGNTGSSVPVRGLSALAVAVRANCFDWLAQRLLKKGTESLRFIVTESLASSFACEIKLRQASVKIAVRVTPNAQAVRDLRDDLKDHGIIAQPRDLILSRIITLPDAIKDGRSTVHLKDVDPKSREIDFLAQLGEGPHGTQMELFGSTPRATTSIVESITTDIRNSIQSPYVLDFFMALNFRMTQAILENPSKDSVYVPTRIRWEDIAQIIGWEKDNSTTWRIRSQLTRMINFLKRHDVRFSNGNKFVDYNILSATMLNEAGHGRANSESFIMGDFTPGTLFSEAIFNRKTLKPALIHAGNIFHGIKEIEGGKDSRKAFGRRLRQLLQISIDVRTWDAVQRREDTGVVRLRQEDIVAEVGIKLTPKKEQCSRQARHQKIIAAKERTGELLQELKDMGHIDRFSYDSVQMWWNITAGKEMREAHIALIAGERARYLPQNANDQKHLRKT